MNGLSWKVLNGAMVFIDSETGSRLTALGARVTEPKDEHISLLKPKAPTLTLEDVNKCVYLSKDKKGNPVEKADFRKLSI